MSDTDKILQAISEMQKDIHNLRGEVKNLDLKVEAFHSEQTKANTKIISAFHDTVEVNAQETDKRFTRIEKHLNLPPLK